MTTKQHLTNLRRISKLYDIPALSYYRFTAKDNEHISMITYVSAEPYDETKDGRYDFGILPNCFLHNKNDVAVAKDAITINGMVIPSRHYEGDARYNCKPPEIDWEKRDAFSTTVNGSVLRAMASPRSEGEWLIGFIRDGKSARIELIEILTDRNYRVIMSYPIGEGTEDKAIISTISQYLLKRYKNLIPSETEVEITFAEECPVKLEWKDDADNSYSVLLAPRIWGNYNATS